VYPPSLDFTLAFLACLKVGVVAVPVFPPNPARRDTLHMFSKIVESCSAKFALTSLEYNHLKKIAGNYDEKPTRLPNIKVPECTYPVPMFVCFLIDDLSQEFEML
jgi:acyl-CoA synthetase (AMP-forming)/AMP-acid ligase II